MDGDIQDKEKPLRSSKKKKKMLKERGPVTIASLSILVFALFRLLFSLPSENVDLQQKHNVINHVSEERIQQVALFITRECQPCAFPYATKNKILDTILTRCLRRQSYATERLRATKRESLDTKKTAAAVYNSIDNCFNVACGRVPIFGLLGRFVIKASPPHNENFLVLF